MNNLKCLNCGAIISEIKDGVGRCSFCGSTMYVNQLDDTSNNNNAKVLVIKNGTSVIEDGQFKDNKIIEKVVFPKSLSKIGNNAFENCSNLKEAEFIDNISEIGNYAFMNSGLENIKLPKTIKKIGNGAFMNCQNLKNVTIECLDIKFEAPFKKCMNLTKANVDLRELYPSFKKSAETYNKKDKRPTYFDAFQSTPLIDAIKVKFRKSYDEGVCFLCGGQIEKKVFSCKCIKCGVGYQKNI